MNLIPFRYRPLARVYRAIALVALLTGASALLAPITVAAEVRTTQAASDDALAGRLARLVERVEARRVASHIPGVAVAITKGDDVLLLRGFGVRDVERGLPVAPDTLFAIGSHTKSFTAALLAMLVDEGALSWDDPVRRHLPEFHLQDEEADAKAALRDLLSHRTGLTRLSLLWASGSAPREEVVRRVADAKPLAPFRERFLYNNVTYMTAGLAAEAAAGASWESLVQARIFDPLSMRSSNTSTPQSLRNPHLSLGYQWEESGQSWTRLPMRTLTSVAPAGAINSTAADLSRWLRFVANKGVFKGRRLLAAERFEEMWTPQIEVGGETSYGLGWMLSEVSGHRVAHHGGNIDGFSSMVGVFPDDGVGFALLANVTATPLQQEIISIVAETLLAEESALAQAPDDNEAGDADDAQASGKPDDLTPYLGRYHLDALDRDVTVLERDGRLALDVPGQTVFTLKWPDDEGRWVFELTDQIAVEFTPGDDGPMASLTVHQAGQAMPALRVSADAGFTAQDIEALLAKQADLPKRFRLTGSIIMEHQGVSGAIEALVDGERFASTQDFGVFGAVRAVYDGARGWQDAPGTPPRELFGELLEQLRLESAAAAALPVTELYERVEPMRIEEREDRRVYIVRLIPAHAPAATTYIDAETGRILRRETSISIPGAGGGIPIAVEFEDFRPLGHSEFPFRIISQSVANGRIVVQFEEVDLAPAIESDAFTMNAVEQRATP